VFIALFWRHRLAPGERGFVLCLSATKAQAELIKSYALAFIEASPILRQQLVSVTGDEIELSNNITIGVHTNSFRTIRGRTILAAVFDEVAFWRDESSAVPDLETYRAVAPSLAASGGMLIGISSPYRSTGLLANRHRDHYGKDSGDVLVIQAPSMALNPTIDEAIIAQARAEDPASAASEWDGSFRTDLQSLLADDVIERAIDHDRPLELARQPDIRYRAFVDASAGRHDASTITIGHVIGDGDSKSFIADVVRARASPHNPNEAAKDHAALARSYGITEVVGDNYAGEWVSQAFRDAGIGYKKSDLPKSQLYLEGISSFNRGVVNLPNDPALIRELRQLERQTHRSGQDSVDHPRGGSDDSANSLFGAMWICGVAGTKRRGEVRVGVYGPGGGEITWLDRGGGRAFDAERGGCIPTGKNARTGVSSFVRN
jgi:hypothetical protein